MFAKCNILYKNALLNYQISKLLTNNLSANTDHPKPNNVERIHKVLACIEKTDVRNLASFANALELPVNERKGLFQELGVADINNEKIFDLTKLHLATLKNRVMFMQECGFQHDKINPVSVKKFLSLTHWDINSLKNKLFIEKSTNVYLHLLNHAQLLDHYSPMPDSCALVAIKLQLLRLLLKHEIGITDEVLDSKREILKRLKNKSIRIIKKNIDIAKNILGMSSHKICRNSFILWTDPDNTLKIIEEIKEIGGLDIKICMSLYPKIISSSYENTKDILQCLKEYNFSNIAIQRGIFLFTLSSQSVRNRLKDLEKEELLTLFKQNPRVLSLVYYYNKIIVRLQQLREINVQNTSLSQISSSSQKRFDKYYAHGSLRHDGDDTLHYLSSEFHCDKKELRLFLKKRPFWSYVPLIEIARNLKVLRERGFSDNEIFTNIYALFYNGANFVEELNALDEREGLESCKKNGIIKKNYILPLVIYFIEKKQNFSFHTLYGLEIDTHSDIVIPEYKTDFVKQI